jgi:glycosyltransferase involved in cell wall biosynthesis
VLALAGCGPDEDALKHLADSLELSHVVNFLGLIPKDEMDALYSAADCFVMASETETQGLVVAEARACGLPVVVVDAGGAPETVLDGKDGLKVPCGDIDAFAHKVTTLLLNDDMRQDMSMTARANAINYTPERMLDRVIEVYQSAAQQPQRARSLVPPFEGKAQYWNIFSPR